MECDLINISVICKVEGTNVKTIVPSWRW